MCRLFGLEEPTPNAQMRQFTSGLKWENELG